MSKSRIKRLTAAVLSMALAISAIPLGAYAAEEMKYVTVDGSVEGDFRVLERGDELLFSAEDLAEISGFSYEKKDEQIILSRGAKDVRIDPKKAQMYLLEGTGADTDRKLKTKPVEEDGDWFLPGSEVLPQLNISIFSTEDGILCVSRDIVSIWDIYEDFDAKDYKFDFARACTNMGVKTNGTKVLAALNNKGILGNIVGWVPFENESSIAEFATYNSIFEDMLFESDSSVKMWNTIWENEEVIDERKKILELTEKAADVTNVPVEIATQFFKEFGKYAVLADQTEVALNDKLAMLKAVTESYGGVNHYPSEIRLRASNTRASYDSFDIIGAITRALESFPEFTLDVANPIDLSIWIDPFYKSLDLPAPVFAEELKDVDNAVYYEVLSNCARVAFEDYGMKHGTDCFRHHAMIYIYACEYSWRAMAEYAKRLKSSYADDFEFIADTCLERKGELYACAASSVNDNRGFDEKADEEETKRVKNLFKLLEKTETKKNDANVDTDIDFREGEKHVSIDNSRNGSNNYNVNYVGEYPQTEGVTMISDGTYLYISDMQALVPGIWRYPLKGTMSQYDYGELVYEISWPESATEHSMMYPDYMGPLTMGIYDKDTLCVVMPTGKSDASWENPKDYYNEEIVEFQKIPAFDVTYAREGEVYDTCAIDTVWAQSRIVGEWFYFERSTGDAERALMRKSIINGKEETIYTYHSGHPDLNKLTYMVDDEYLVALRSPYITDKTETTLIVMDLRSRKIEHIDLSEKVYQADRLYGIYDGFIYFNGIKEDNTNPMYRMRIGVWEEECVLSNMPIFTEGAQINFYDNTMYLLDHDNLYIVPLDNMGKAGTDYEKIRLHTVISINDLCLYPENGGIWIWDEKLWVFSCLQEYNSSLKVLIDCATGERYLDSINWDLVSDPIPPLTDEEIAELEKTMRETEEAEETSTAADTQEPKETVSYDEIPPLEEQWIIDDLIMSYMNQVEGPTDNISVVIDKQEFYPEWMLMDIEATVMAGSGDERVECPFLVNYQYTSGIGWNLVDMLMMGYYLVNED